MSLGLTLWEGDTSNNWTVAWSNLAISEDAWDALTYEERVMFLVRGQWLDFGWDKSPALWISHDS